MTKQIPPTTNFRTIASELSPTALQGPNGAALMYTLSVPYDTLAVSGAYAVRFRFPTLTSPDALPWLAKDRQIVRGPNESQDSYAQRLVQWLDLWVHAGSAPSILQGVASFFLPGTITAEHVKQSRTGYTDWDYWDGTTDTLYREAPANWDWDSDGLVPCDARFQRVNKHGVLGPYWHTWTILYDTGYTSDGTWADPGTWDDGGTWDTDASPDDVAAIRGQVRQWKSAESFVQWIVVALDSTWFVYSLPAADPKLPDGHWGRWGKVITSGGSRVYTPSRSDTASYWDGM